MFAAFCELIHYPNKSQQYFLQFQSFDQDMLGKDKVSFLLPTAHAGYLYITQNYGRNSNLELSE